MRPRRSGRVCHSLEAVWYAETRAPSTRDGCGTWLVQRSLIVAASYFATTQGLGTHLDVSAIQEVTLPAGPGDQTLAQWISLMVFPQYVLWIPFTMVLGLAVGAPLFVVAKRRAGLSSPSSEGQP